MIRVFIILVLSCVSLNAAAPFLLSLQTNDLVAVPVVSDKGRTTSFLLGKTTTNTIYFGGPFWFNTNSAATVDLEDIFPSPAGGRWERMKIGPRSLGSGTPSSSQFLRGDSTWQTFTVGTVTSVALTAPSFISVAGSPITSSGTLALTMANQDPGELLIGPVAGDPAAPPTFRNLAAGDLPSTAVTPGTYGSATGSGTFTVDQQGRLTAASTTAIAGLNASVITAGTMATARLGSGTANSGTVLHGDSTWSAGGSGTVTSVGLALPTSVFDISGSPVTTSGTLTATFDNQSANTFFAGPVTGGAATPAFRSLEEEDITQLGSNPSASIGLSTVNGSASTYMRSDGAPALDQGIVPTMTGTWTFKNGDTYFGSADTYNVPPVTRLQARLETSTGVNTSVAQIEMGKENATSANTSGYMALATRANGGSMVNKLTISSAGVVNINQMTASRYMKSSSGKDVSTTETETANTVFAGPTSGGAAVPAFRALVTADVSSIVPTFTSSQVIGAGTAYTLTASYARVDFGTTDAQVTLPDAGTYLVTALIGMTSPRAGTTTRVDFEFYNSTDSAAVSGSIRGTQVLAASLGEQITLQNVITVAASKTIQIYGQAPTAGQDVDVISTETSVSYVRLY